MELIAQTKAKDPELGAELERECRKLAKQQAFGLNFERNPPESVPLPGRKIQAGDKVLTLPKRGATQLVDKTIWVVQKIEQSNGVQRAYIGHPLGLEPEYRVVDVDDLIGVAEPHDPIYPGLVSDGKVKRGKDKPCHILINGENLHALKVLSVTHRGKIDAIYIDPPYNSGSKNWKYNNDYVESKDSYPHSKWLAMMERRLKIAKELLNPTDAALIATIDEKEYLRLGLLLHQVFPNAHIQMISSQINAKGIIRDNEFTRTNEFLFYVGIGAHRITPERVGKRSDKVRWASLRRADVESARGTQKGGPDQFYPIYVNQKTGKIEGFGQPLKAHEDISTVPERSGCTMVLPIRDQGDVKEMNWGLTIPTLEKRLEKGFAKAIRSGRGAKKKTTLYYLTSGIIKSIEKGDIVIDAYDDNGVAEVSFATGKYANPTTQWVRESHNAQSHGSDLLKRLIGKRGFPYPKSLYAVEDALRIAVGNKKEALVLDFFGGSGTTTHAIMRLNRQDDGQRQCILITNNEVSPTEQAALRQKKLRSGDPQWEALGICEHITKPRIKAAITGQTPSGEPIKGDYKFTDPFPMADGFQENAEFFTLGYADPNTCSPQQAFKRIAPFLWMTAGSKGRRIDEIPECGWAVADTYGLLANLDQSADFKRAVQAKTNIKIAFIVTDNEGLFQTLADTLPQPLKSVRLSESQLSTFGFVSGDVT